jgi:hypothetical protein
VATSFEFVAKTASAAGTPPITADAATRHAATAPEKVWRLMVATKRYLHPLSQLRRRTAEFVETGRRDGGFTARS